MPDSTAAYPAPGLLIDGEWLRSGLETIPVVNPADESVLAHLPVAGKAELDAALAAAERGFAVWRATGPTERAAVMLKAAALLRERVESIAPRISLELGKTLDEARYEVLRAADILTWDAGEAQRAYGRINPSRPGWRHMVIREPIGVVAGFTPWNAPIGSPSRKISAALAAGCSMVIKPSEETPASACALAECLQDAGLPRGVLNVVFGHPDEISRHLIASPVVRLVTFTGSVAVGKHLAQLAGLHMKATLMELGGHAAVVVCGDADPKTVARLAVTAKFRMGGQVCVSPTRFLVQRNIYAAFVDAFAGGAAALKVGPGLEQGSQMGALVNGRRLNAIQSLVNDAVQRGARVAAGGERVGDRGYFYRPTVISDVPDDATALREEPFGPLALVMPFDDLDDAIRIANKLQVGLAGYAFTNSLANADRLANQLECGLLSINHFGAAAPDMPFGGVKDSGFGREGGAESLDSYTITKMVSVRSTIE